MNKRGKIMVGGAILSVIGIIIMFFGFNKYKNMEGSMLASGAQQGTAETIIGILIFVVGAFIVIYGFGQLEENRKLQETK
jgi:uncharacterized membrane protein